MHAKLLQSFAAIVTPWTVARQATVSMGFSRQEFWSGLPFPPPRWRIYGSIFSIHSASLCLLVGTCSQFTFKVIFDDYVLIAILLIVWDLFLFFFCFFVPFLICSLL